VSASPESPKPLLQVAEVPAGAGVKWIRESFTLLGAQPFGWLSLVAAWFMFSVVGYLFVPLIGPPIIVILQPAFFAGFVLAARAQEAGHPIGTQYLFAAFRVNAQPLITLGCISLLAEIMVMVTIGLLGFHLTLPKEAADAGDFRAIASAMARELDGQTGLILLAFAISTLLKAVLWFSAALLALNPMPATHAIRWSCYALIANIVPMLLFAMLLTVMFMAASLPLFLGMVVALPIYAIVHYTSYRDLFRSPPEV
jgi:uncharacterized membrane protein